MRIVLAIAALLLVAGCGGSADDGRRDVVAGFYPLAFAAERVGGDGVSVTNLTPPGAEPHDVELSPQDVAKIQEADLVLYLSHGFQPAVEEALGDARGASIDALDGLDLRGGDPHVWLDPVRFERIAARVGTALRAPERARELGTELQRLDREYRAGLADCSSRVLVTAHRAFGYLAERYGLRELSIAGTQPEAEPSGRALAELVRRVRSDGVRVVFVETLVSPELGETVAREAGASVAVLDPIEALTDEEADRGDDYFTLMRRNLATLRKGLGCR